MRLFLILGLILISNLSYGFGVQYANSFKKNIQTIINAHPRYVWGGSESEAKGVDCSGYIHLAAKRSGMPVSRTTSRNMRHGLGGWAGYDIMFNSAEELDIVWWSFTSTRPNGHIGILWRDKDGFPAVTHSSTSSKGVTVGYIQGSLFRDISAVRRITLGESPKTRRDNKTTIFLPYVDK
jgi:hypothetical protein